MTSKKNISITTVSVLLILVISYIYFHFFSRTIEFKDMPIAINIADHLNIPGTKVLEVPSSDIEAIKSYIGLLAIRSNTNGEISYDNTLAPNDSEIIAKKIDEMRYHGIISEKTNVGANFTSATSSLGTDELAEVDIKNVLIVNYNPQKTPYKKLKSINLSPDKEVFFISTIIVTEITKRKFKKFSGSGKIDGIAFGANGNIYISNENTEIQRVINFTAINPFFLKDSEAGTSSKLEKLVNDAITGDSDRKNAIILQNLLETSTYNQLPPSLKIEKLPPRLPKPLTKMEKIIWLSEIIPVAQSSDQTCWAAATAMLYSWHNKKNISEMEAVESIGSFWANLQKKGMPIIPDYKLAFLNDGGFKYDGPQCYSVEALVALLQKHGPIWFTISLDENRHACILTGIFREQTGEYWVSYIDPRTGNLEADTFPGFMRRYELPAKKIRNDDPNDMLDIQVVFI